MRTACGDTSCRRGPFEWSDKVGAAALAATLTAITAATGQPMYHPSEYWSAQL